LTYVFDTNSLSIILRHYYPGRFPTFWNKFNKAAEENILVSVRESRFELLEHSNHEITQNLPALEKYNGNFFAKPTIEELAFITRIYSVPHFQWNLEKKKLLKGGSFADPFIIAKANMVKGIVVTEEAFKENAAKIPNICQHFDIECVNLEGFLLSEDWEF